MNKNRKKNHHIQPYHQLMLIFPSLLLKKMKYLKKQVNLETRMLANKDNNIIHKFNKTLDNNKFRFRAKI